MGILTDQLDGRKVIFYTFAYNASKTLFRTINSVFAQTCPDWIWYLVDNGSIDDTGRIIQEYAGRDTRIIPLTNKQNHVWEKGNRWWEVIWRHSDNDFLCFLDADDEYKSDFLAKMLAFVSANELEIAACGNDLIQIDTGTVVRERTLQRDWLLKSREFSECFIQYYQFMHTMWGKLYAISVLKKFNWGNTPLISYGWDTLFAMENFRNASRIGILAESLHKYYLSPKSSVSFKLDAKRIESTRIVHEANYKFLNDKCGGVSHQNEEFLLYLYMDSIRRALSVHLNAPISLSEKLASVIDVFTHKYTKHLIAQRNFGINLDSVATISTQRRELFSSVADWLLSLSEVPDELFEGYCDTGEVLCAAIENAGGWLCFKKLRVQFLLEQSRKDEAKDKLAELVELIPDDPEVIAFQQSLIIG